MLDLKELIQDVQIIPNRIAIKVKDLLAISLQTWRKVGWR